MSTIMNNLYLLNKKPLKKIISQNKVRPFIKWAGGKKQLLPLITRILPEDFLYGNMAYIEPFVGSGALLFWVLNNIPNIKEVIINDANPELINGYFIVKTHVVELINLLKKWEKEYHKLENYPLEKEIYYKKKRELFNKKTSDKITQAALFIFLNRTCFNGLYRVNKKGEFNVPMGKYRYPKICDEENLINISKTLEKVKILNEDFEDTLNHTKTKSFFYLDPPYKPLSQTSNFTSYFDKFDDNDQIRLKHFCDKVDKMGHLWMLSNSDPKNSDIKNNFFDRLYNKYYIIRVPARRNINSKAEKRGKITELLITNYPHSFYKK